MKPRPSLFRISLHIFVRLSLGLLLVGLGIVVAGGSLHAHAAPAATLTVTDCSGETGPGQIGTVISSASAGDKITFSCSGTIHIRSTLIISTHNLTLDGSGQNVTLDGGGSVMVLFLNNGPNFNLNALTIAHGRQTSSSDLSNGGGLYLNGGPLRISNSTFANNSATYGGGLYINGGTVSISNSTFTNNSAPGGIGSGLYNNGGTVNISNSTFANNSASGGLSTFGGGTVSISHSIVAHSSDSFGRNCSVALRDQGYNLESGTDCGFTGTGSLQNTNPKLISLASNGGPTQTMALVDSSPAIDRIPTASCPATDQRGMTRPDDSETACDMGAYESNYPPDHDLALTNVPANITTSVTSSQGAVVTYTLPTATDESGDNPTATVSCSPQSGSTFPIGTTTVTCKATDSDDSNSPVSQSFTVTVKPTLMASGTSVSATEGRSFSGVVVATGADYGTGTLSASIQWGDGQTSTGSVSLATDGSYSVKGSHVYDEEGSFALTVTVSESSGSTTTVSSSASVTDAALTANTPTVTIKKLAVTIGTVFFDADPNGTASDYSVTITPGDGSSSTGTISANSTSFTATSSHTYSKHTTYTVTVTIKDAGGSTVTKTLSVKV